MFYKKTRRLNKSEINVYSFHALITVDRMSYNYASKASDSQWTQERYGLSESANALGRFIVDVNGQKAPNMVGIDRFYFILLKGEGIVPAGRDSTANCNYSDSGASCAAKVIREKKIDYPKS